MQLVEGKSYCLDATEKRPDTESFAVIDGTSSSDAVTAAIDAGKTTLYVTGEEVDYIGSAISNSEAAEGSIDLILADATAIGESAFHACNALASVELPAATSIGNYAFMSCSALASVSLPAAETIGDNAFDGCSALASVSLPAATKIGVGAFAGTTLTSVSLPEATTIGGGAFFDCEDLASVELPAATTIGKQAFQQCYALASVSAPKATSIGDAAFWSCTSLASVSLPAATTIGEYAFDACDALTSLTFGSVITSVGTDAFLYVPTETCALTLNSGQLSSTGTLKPSGKTWAGETWASIRYVDDEGNAVTVIDGAATDADALKAQISAALAAGQSTIYVGGHNAGDCLEISYQGTSRRLHRPRAA